jgi:hypothetical protein
MDGEQIKTALVRGAEEADLAVIEGAMGLFDGVDLKGTGSTAQIARITRSPVVLVVDATRATRSVAPLVLGFMNFEPDVRIAGVIFKQSRPSAPLKHAAGGDKRILRHPRARGRTQERLQAYSPNGTSAGACPPNTPPYGKRSPATSPWPPAISTCPPSSPWPPRRRRSQRP